MQIYISVQTVATYQVKPFPFGSLQTDTARVIYSWNEADPAGDDPNAVIYHGNTNRGTQSLNLMGGQQVVPPDPADLESFDVIVNNVC